jgi:YebC/PmpR family DNA-binding regulatory protein
MSGHSKWATTKRKKARIDNARAKVFNKIIREITVSARLGGSDQEANSRLRTAVLKAKMANMPTKNIENAIAKGAGELDGVNYTENIYEGYGPGGIAIIVDCLTDNKTRTVADVRHIFSKCGGNMGEPGSVAWMFNSKGIITLSKDKISEEELMDLIIDAGAEDIETSDEEYIITMEPESFNSVVDILTKHNLETNSAEVTKIAETKSKVDSENAPKAYKLLDMLEDHDDVQNVSTNAEFDDSDLEML